MSPEQYRRHYAAYFRIFQRCGLKDVITVQSDTGMMGGKLAHEFMMLADVGEDTLVLCDACGASANLQVAQAKLSLAQRLPQYPFGRCRIAPKRPRALRR